MTSTGGSNSSSSTGGCPVKHSPSSSSDSNTIQSSPWGSWFRKQPPQQEQHQPQPCGSDSINQGSCPIQSNNKSDGNGSLMQTMAIPNSIEEAAKHAQTPQPGQTIPLSTHRTMSSIPKGTNTTNDATKSSSPTTPNHQPQNESKWVYPSEQQFYNAMKRKGWDIAPGTESTIPFVVQIHNAVNERGWKEIREWESMRHNKDPKLVKFIGRPKDLSPKARLLSGLWLRKEPFDRHDWYVSREDGSDMRRYVIDFYNGKEEEQGQGQGQQQSSLPSMYLDVRPALDDSDAAIDIMKMFAKDAFPGIASLFK